MSMNCDIKNSEVLNIQILDVEQGRSHVSKIGVSVLIPSCLYERQTTSVKSVNGRGMGRGWKGVSPSPAANDLRAFHVQFNAISRIFSAFNSCLEMGDSYILCWLVDLIFPF